MTWDFLKLCMETLVFRVLLREVRAQNLPWSEGLPVQEQAYDAVPVRELVIRDVVHDAFALKFPKAERGDFRKWHGADLEAIGNEEGLEESEVDVISHREDSSRHYQCLRIRNERFNEDLSYVTITPSLKTYSWRPVDGTPRISTGIGPGNGLVILGTRLRCETDSNKMELSSRRWRSLRCGDLTMIPVKLLYGPWTEDKLSFFRALKEGGGALD